MPTKQIPSPMVNVSLFPRNTSLLPRDLFRYIVKKHESDKYNKGIDNWTHLISMLFCQFGQANSVRYISNGLRSITGNIHYLGCCQAPSKLSVSYVNDHRTSRVMKSFTMPLRIISSSMPHLPDLH